MAAKQKNIVIEPLKETHLHIELVGDSDLILHGKSRYYMQSEIWKQSHDKGSEMPGLYKQGKNPWEAIITSIHWEKPIAFHDKDISLYTEDELKYYLDPKNNRPCILGIAFQKSFVEAFTTFFKASTGKNGTDFKRATSITSRIIPVDFAKSEVTQTLVPTTGIGSTNVYCAHLTFSGWKCELDISSVDTVFPYETVLSLISTSGKYIGIGSQRGNGFGRYHIGDVQLIKG